MIKHSILAQAGHARGPIQSPEGRSQRTVLRLPKYTRNKCQIASRCCKKSPTVFRMKVSTFISLFTNLASWTSTSPVVQTRDGPVLGTRDSTTGIISFKGIPYASPPTGDLRWQSPIAPKKWNTPIDATTYGPSCYSFFAGAPGPSGESEDCLTANIWTSGLNPEDLRPVMVFIYGGGFEFGSSAVPTYDGTHFAEQGAVLVSFNYRLGNFGFLAHPELDREGPSGNFGLQDQLLALRWIRQNIRSFGGDPDNILVFGESAGAHAIGLLMASPLAQGAFDKAILESGAWWDTEHGSITTFEQARQIGAAWTNRIGVSSVSGLRELSSKEIVNSSLWSVLADPGTTAFSPSIDSYVLPAAPGAIFEAGRQLKIPLLAGWNQVEESLFLPRALPHQSAEQFKSGMKLLFGAETPLYPADTDAQASDSANALIGDLVIRQQTWEIGDLHARGGNSVYLYYYTYNSSYSPVASHTAELPFVFGTFPTTMPGGPPAPVSGADREFSKQTMSFWINFARLGNPNGANLLNWDLYGGGKGIIELGKTIKPSTYDLSRFKFIQSFRSNGVLPASWRSVNPDTTA